MLCSRPSIGKRLSTKHLKRELSCRLRCTLQVQLGPDDYVTCAVKDCLRVHTT